MVREMIGIAFAASLLAVLGAKLTWLVFGYVDLADASELTGVADEVG